MVGPVCETPCYMTQKYILKYTSLEPVSLTVVNLPVNVVVTLSLRFYLRVRTASFTKGRGSARKRTLRRSLNIYT